MSRASEFTVSRYSTKPVRPVSNQNAMYITTAVLDLREFWIEQLPCCKLYALYLAVVAIYTIVSLSRTLFRLGFLGKQTATEDQANRSHSLALLQSKSDNLRQLTLFSTLLFGLVFFLQIRANFVSPSDSSLTGWAFIDHSLASYFDFAACVFLVLIILHVSEWIVSAHLRRLPLPH